MSGLESVGEGVEYDEQPSSFAVHEASKLNLVGASIRDSSYPGDGEGAGELWLCLL